MTFREAKNSGMVFAEVQDGYSHIYYPTATVTHMDNDQYYLYVTGVRLEDIIVSRAVTLDMYNKSLLDEDNPNIELLGPYEQPEQPKICTCDFYSVILVSGCQCGGK